jgi:general secretion pathway protein F
VSTDLIFAFRAVRQDGSVESGMLCASSREAAAAILGRRGVLPIALEASPRPGRLTARLPADDVAGGLRALAMLLEAGIPIARALSIMDDLVPVSWKPLLPELRRRVEQGSSLSAALEASVPGTPTHVIGVIGAGEAGGGLSAAVSRAAEWLERRAASRADLRNALAYPMILAVAGTASITLLVGLVLPRFTELLLDTGQAVPLLTRAVLTFGQLVKATLIPVTMGLLLAIGVWSRWVRTSRGKLEWHRMLLRMPVVGTIRRASGAASGCAALAALLDTGVPLPAALPPAARATGDEALAAALLRARDRITTGTAVSAALQAEGAMPPTVIRLVRAGEETGQLAAMLGRAGHLEATRALRMVQRATRVVEPSLILLFGGIITVVAAALLQAMYGLRVGP